MYMPVLLCFNLGTTSLGDDAREPLQRMPTVFVLASCRSCPVGMLFKASTACRSINRSIGGCVYRQGNIFVYKILLIVNTRNAIQFIIINYQTIRGSAVIG